MKSHSSRYSGANQVSVRRNNRAMIYRAIWDLGPIPRVELASRTGLHAATITHIVDELVAEGLVKETGIGESSVGRPPVHLEIEPAAAHVLGVHLARDGVRAVVADLRGRSVEQVSFMGLRGLADREAVFYRVVHTIQMLLDVSKAGGYRVVGVGVGAPGPVDSATGQVYRSPNWSMHRDDQALPLRDMLAERFALPVYVDNNANASALAERYFGAGRTLSNFLYISSGFGVGGGVIMEGELYKGFYGGAGEVGHVTVDTAGPRCTCGNIGCLELYASVPAILGRAAGILGVDASELTPGRVAAACAQGHPGVLDLVAGVSGYLATAVVNAVNTLAPEAVIIGGLLGELAPIMAERVQEEVRHRVFSVLSKHVRVLGSGLADAPVLGAATLVIREVLRNGNR